MLDSAPVCRLRARMVRLAISLSFYPSEDPPRYLKLARASLSPLFPLLVLGYDYGIVKLRI